MIKYENATTKKEMSLASNGFIRCFNEGKKQAVLERKELFRLLEKYIDSFWD